MIISKFRILNYKSYIDSTEVKLDYGINIITGQNNAGKTALLQALSLSFSDKPHKSSITVPSPITNVDQKSKVELEIMLSDEELDFLIFNYLDHIRIPVTRNSSVESYNGNNFRFSLFNKENVFDLNYKPSKFSGDLKSIGKPTSNLYYTYKVDKEYKTFQFLNQTSDQGELINQLGINLKNRLYFFHAERLNIGSSAFGTNPVLASNASNLPEVLEILQGDHYRFRRYNEYVRKIFPQIHWISVRPNPNNRVEIVVWNEDPKLERADLVVPLSESGTGLAQVLAILYVVLTSNISSIILIDEPNSFLHPGACRKLIEILKEHPQHQFIISTHSPSTIAAGNPKTISVVTTENAQSKIQSIDVNETKQQQLYLAEIGSKLSDVFGADNILWVEGKTEEICFPKIIESTPGISLMGTSILAVKNTGDFESKHSKTIFDIYDKLSKGKGLLPPSVGFIFDRENKSQKQMDDLKRQAKNTVFFTKRMMYENYLLNSAAIFNVLRSIEETQDIEITQELIDKWMIKNKWEEPYIDSKHVKAKSDEEWVANVHAARFLDDLFSKMTNKRVAFDKIKHSVALTEWIITNSFDDLREIREILVSILK